MSFIRVFKQFLETIGTFWPIFSVMFLLISSLFNNSLVKGIFYFTGLFIIWLFWQLLLYAFRPDGRELNSFIFSITSLNFLNLTSVNTDSIMYILSPITVWFTNLYIFFTMIYSPIRKPGPNASFIGLIIAGTLCNIYSTFYQKNTEGGNESNKNVFPLIYFCLSVVGVLFGILWFYLSNINPNKLLFTDILYQNSQLCNLDKNKNFTCQFYKNGIPIKNQ